MSIIRYELLINNSNLIELVIYEKNVTYKYFFYKQIENNFIKFETLQIYNYQLYAKEINYLVTNNICVTNTYNKRRNTVLLKLTPKSLLEVL